MEEQVPRSVTSAGAHYRFGVFDFDADTLELRREDRHVRLRPQSLKLLALLLARAGELVSRESIQQALWGSETFVDFEQGVNHAVREIRGVLGDSADSPRFIQTLARRGYRFIAPVVRLPEPVLPAGHAPEQAPSWAPPAEAAGAHAHGPPAATAPQSRSWKRRWPMMAAAALILLAAIVPWSRSRPDAGSLPTIAVLPFASPGSDAGLGPALAMAIGTRLSAQRLVVVGPAGFDSPASGAPDHRARASLLGATLVLSGEVTRQTGNVAVAARMEKVPSGETVWDDRFQLRPDELLSLENVIAERVVGALSLRLAADDQERLRRRYTSDAKAYEEYLRGRAKLVRYTPDDARDAIDAFESALRRDPAYALARAGLAMASADMYLRFAPPAEVAGWGQRAETEAHRALEQDANLAEAHLARAAVARKREFDWNLVMASSRRALVLNPTLDQAHFFMAAAYYHHGYMEEALIEVQRGQRLRGPDAIEPIRIRGLIALWSGQFAPARVHLEEVSRLSSQAIGDAYLALAYYSSGSADRGLAMLESLTGSPSASTASRAAATLAGILASRGHAAGARRHIDLVLGREYRDHHVAYGLGAAYAQLGDLSAAIGWLRTAADTGFPCVPWFERDPLLESLRARPEFAPLLEYVRNKREMSLR